MLIFLYLYRLDKKKGGYNIINLLNSKDFLLNNKIKYLI